MVNIKQLAILADKFAQTLKGELTDKNSWTCKTDGKAFHLPSDHKPYMVLSTGGTGPFSCANCVALYEKGDEYHCKSPDYTAFMGSSLLVDENGAPLNDPSRACSDWFSPKKD